MSALHDGAGPAQERGTLALLVFHLDDQRYALPLHAVERVIRAVELTALPAAPEGVLGVIDIEGQVLPVACLRRRFGLPRREVAASDHFVIALLPGRQVVLPVDGIQGVVGCDPTAFVPSQQLAAGLDQTFEGVVQLDDGLALIHDLAGLLSGDEARELDLAMRGSR